jgi:uncharacterized RDD family membrane protein YckC
MSKRAISIDDPRVHRLRTPEGISLPFVVAPAGDRINAFLVDFVILAGGTALVWLAAGLTAAVGAGELGVSFALLVHFLLWNFYFIFFEVQWGGVTLGKRKVGLRVISRDGGPLTAEAVIARNLMRNLEFSLPLSALLAPEALSPGAPGWASLLAILWILVFALMPLFNRDRLRCGDLVAGTMVVLAPVSVLLPDLAEHRPDPYVRRDAPAREEISFTREQLDIYGVLELQTLEDLLRRDEEGTLDGVILEDVGEKIKNKISWPRERWNVPLHPFLEAFYRAQRRRLEQQMLFGQRKERKEG